MARTDFKSVDEYIAARSRIKFPPTNFPLSRPVPVKLIGRIAKFRAKEAVAREKTSA